MPWVRASDRGDERGLGRQELGDGAPGCWPCSWSTVAVGAAPVTVCDSVEPIAFEHACWLNFRAPLPTDVALRDAQVGKPIVHFACTCSAPTMPQVRVEPTQSPAIEGQVAGWVTSVAFGRIELRNARRFELRHNLRRAKTTENAHPPRVKDSARALQ
jgi:hypothetical protein